MTGFLRKAALPAAVCAASLLAVGGIFIWLLGQTGPEAVPAAEQALMNMKDGFYKIGPLLALGFMVA